MSPYNKYQKHPEPDCMKEYISFIYDIFKGHEIDIHVGKFTPSLSISVYTDMFREQEESFKLYLHGIKDRETNEDFIKIELQCFRPMDTSPDHTYKSNSVETVVKKEIFKDLIKNVNKTELFNFCRKFNRWNEDWIESTRKGYEDEYLQRHQLEEHDYSVEFKLLFI